MKQLFSTLLICIVALTTKAQTTVDPYIVDHYSSEIVARMYSLVNKTNINGNKQIAIADIFKSQDSAITVLIRNNATKSEIDNINDLYQNSWKSILSATDEFYYSTETIREARTLRYSYTLLALTIKSKEVLNLSVPLTEYLLSKIDSLKLKEELFYQQNPSMIYNSYSLQNGYINAVLNDAQYRQLIELKGQAKAHDKAGIDWSALNELGLATGLDRDSTTAQFTKFYLDKDFVYGRYDQNLILRRKYLQQVYDAEPAPVRKLYYARKFKNAHANNKPTGFSQFLFAIKNTDSLSLNEDQIRNLFAKANELESLKEEAYLLDSSKPYDARKFECENLKVILISEQYDHFLILKNLGRAKNIAMGDWNELTQRNMIAGHDREATINELTNYYFQRQSIYDRYEDDKVMQSQMIRELYETKPRALTALIHARRNPGNNTQGQGYTW